MDAAAGRPAGCGQHPTGERPSACSVRASGIPAPGRGTVGARIRPPSMRHSPAVRRRRFFAALAAVLTAVVPWSARAAAAQGDTSSPGRIFLVSQNPWTVNGNDLVLGLRVADSRAPDALEVAVTLCARVNTRSDFALTLSDRPPCNPIAVVNPRLSDLPVGPDGTVTLTMPVRDKVAAPGVYPARVELRERRGREIDHFVTHVVSVPATPDATLGVALVLPVAGDVGVTKSGGRQLAPGAADTVATVTEAAAAHPSVPLTLLPSPAALQLLAASPNPRDTSLVTSLAQQATGLRQLVAGPYVPVSLPAFTAAGLTSEESAQTVRGTEALEAVTQTRPDPRTWVARDRLDDASVAALTDRGVDRIILPDASLQALPLNRTLTQPFTLEARQGRRISAASADGGLLPHFAANDQPVLSAQHLLADLAVIYFDAPGAKSRAVVAMPPPDWRPDADFLAAALGGLGTSPVLTPMTADGLFNSVAPATAA